MNIKSKTPGEHNTLELVIEVDGKTFDQAVEQVYLRRRKNINIPGFRKGKVPRKMVEKMFGSGVFYEDAVNDLCPKVYREALEQENIKPAAYPSLEVLDVGAEGFSFKAVVPLKPEAKLGTYKGLTAPKAAVEVTEKDIDNELQPFIRRATRLVTVKRKAKKGDTAVIDFEGFDNGVPFEGGKGEGYSLELGSGTFIPGFEEGVIGMKAGEEKDLDVTFPQDYAPELAGKPVVFKVKVQEVKESVAPVLDDEFAKDVSEFDTLADFRKDLGDKLLARKQESAQKDFEQSITDQLIANVEVDMAPALVEEEADRMVQDYANRISSQGIPFDQYLSMMGITVEQFKAQGMDAARRKLLNEFALEAVAKAEKLTVSQEEKDEEIKSLAQQYSMEADQVKAAVPEEDLERDLLLRKAAKFVMDNAKEGKIPAKKTAKKKAEAEGETEKAEKAEKPAKKTAAKKKTKETEE